MTVTITSLYDRRAEAQAAMDQLRERYADGAFRIIDNNPDESDKGGFWASLKQAFLPDEDRIVYGEGIRRGGYMLHAVVDEADADGVCAILEQSGSVDLDERERSWRGEGWQPGHDEGGHDDRPNIGRRRMERSGPHARAYNHEYSGQDRSAFSFGNERAERAEQAAPVSEDLERTDRS